MGDFLETNLLALQKNQPDIFKILIGHPVDPSYQIATVPDGSLVIFRDADGKRTILSHPENAAGQAEIFIHRNAASFTTEKPFFFAGTLAGYEITAMIQKESAEDWRTPRAYYVYSDNPDMLRMTLAIHDWSGLINDARLYFFLGADAQKQLLRFFDTDPAKPQPDQVLVLGGGPTAQDALAALQQAKEKMAESTVANKKILDEYYESLSASELAAAWLDFSRMRILLISNRRSYFIQYSIRDIRMAFESLGATVEVLEEKSPVDKMSGTWLLSALEKFRPHGLVFIDHLRSEYGSIYPERLPFICWLQDYMPGVHSNPDPKGITDRDLVVGTTDRMDQSVYSPSRLFRLPCLTNRHLYAVPKTAPSESPASEFSFVSNISDSTDSLCAQLIERYTPLGSKVQDCIREIYNVIKDLYAHGTMYEDFQSFHQAAYPIVKDADSKLAKDSDFYFQLYNSLVGAAVRHQVLDWISRDGHELSCWGRRWEEHPFLSTHAKGEIENGDDLARLYRNTTFNLHVNQFAVEHPRILDGIMAGGFFLVKKAASTGLLELDECLFAGRAQLRKRIEHFREHPEYRQRIVQKNQEIIRQWATYDVGISNFSTYFALGLIDRWLSDEAAEEHTEPLCSKTVENANSLAYRFQGDAGRFGLYLAASSFAECFNLSENLIEKFDELDRYQTKWGSPTWPYSFSIKSKKKLAKIVHNASENSSHSLCLKAEVLIDSWIKGETKGASIYRFCRKSESVSDNFGGNDLYSPLYRNSEDQSSGYNFQSMIRTSGMNAVNAEVFASAVKLFQKGAVAGAWDLVNPVVDNPKVVGRFVFFASQIAQSLGKTKRSQNLLERFYDWTKSVHALDSETEALIKLSGSLNRLSAGCTCELTSAVKKELGLAEGANVLSKNPPSENVALEQTYPFPAVQDEVLRIDRIRPLGKGFLCRAKNSDAPFWYLDPENADWQPFGSEFSFAGSYPAFDTTGELLYVADPQNKLIRVFDSKLQPVEQFSSPFWGYVEDLAIGYRNTLYLVDPWGAKLYISKNKTDWKAIDISDRQNIETDKKPPGSLLSLSPVLELAAPWKLSRCGQSVLLGTKNKVFVFDENGTEKQRKKISFYNAEYFGLDNHLYTVGQYPLQIGQMDCGALKQTWSCVAADPSTPFLHCCAITVSDEMLWVVDDYLQKLFSFKLA